MSSLKDEKLFFEVDDELLVIVDVFDEVLFFEDGVSRDFLDVVVYFLDVFALLCDELVLLLNQFIDVLKDDGCTDTRLRFLRIISVYFVQLINRNSLG